MLNFLFTPVGVAGTEAVDAFRTLLCAATIIGSLCAKTTQGGSVPVIKEMKK
jgi:hypothetical protein